MRRLHTIQRSCDSQQGPYGSESPNLQGDYLSFICVIHGTLRCTRPRSRAKLQQSSRSAIDRSRYLLRPWKVLDPRLLELRTGHFGSEVSAQTCLLVTIPDSGTLAGLGKVCSKGRNFSARTSIMSCDVPNFAGVEPELGDPGLHAVWTRRHVRR